MPIDPETPASCPRFAERYIIGQNLVQFVKSPLKWRGRDLNLAPGLTSSPQLLTGPAASEGSWRMGWERGKRCVLMGKCLQKELEGRGLPQTSGVDVRGGKRKTGAETTGHVLENFLTQTLPSGIDRRWLLRSPPTLRYVCSFHMWAWGPARRQHSARLWGHDGDRNREAPCVQGAKGRKRVNTLINASFVNDDKC